MTDSHADGVVGRGENMMPGKAILDSERVEYAFDGPSLFWLSFRKMLLTIVTLGIYRFWLTMHLRRHYWSAMRLKGDPFEYTGTGLEKLLGFLIALIILALYLGVINLGLAFAGLVSVDDMVELQLMLQLSLVAALPLIYFATYRARRYILARTRWRGIRFGIDLAAWGFAWRACLLMLLSIVTLGLAYPYQHFRLQKFMIDRTWFGSLKFQQHGSWRTLLGYWIWLYLIGAVIGAAIVWMMVDPENVTAITVGIAITGFGGLALYLMSIRYQVAAFRYLWNQRTLGEARFRNDIDTGEVIGVQIGGTLAVGICVGALFVVINMALGFLTFLILGDNGLEELETRFRTDISSAFDAWQVLIVGGFSYLLVIALAFVFSQIFLIRPILRRKVEGMQIFNVTALQASQQRAHDDAAEAGGFADALGVDLGAGF